MNLWCRLGFHRTWLLRQSMIGDPPIYRYCSRCGKVAAL